MLTKAEVQRLRALREKKQREALGLFVVEGEKVVAELLAAGFPLVEIYATPEWAKPAPGASPRVTKPAAITLVTPEEMARISHFPTPSPVLAVGRTARESLPAGALDRGLTLALDDVQDAGNVGTLLRVADWFAIDRVLLSPQCADRFHQKVINASMGSFARVKVYTVDLASVFAAAKVPILGCDLHGRSVHDLPTLRDVLVVIGNEGQGLSPGLRKFITHYVTIPRYGGAESLNAGMAAAIVCDNLRRQKAGTGI